MSASFPWGPEELRACVLSALPQAQVVRVLPAVSQPQGLNIAWYCSAETAAFAEREATPHEPAAPAPAECEPSSQAAAPAECEPSSQAAALAPSAEDAVLSKGSLASATPSNAATMLAIGAFDGVHRGHQALIHACIEDARAHNARAIVLLFDPDPAEFFSGPASKQRLLSIEDRIARCLELGADAVCAIRFNEAVANCAPDDFFKSIASNFKPLLAIHVGENFRFGKAAAGSVETLAELAGKQAIRIEVHSLYASKGAPLSATRVRASLAEGHVQEAAELLGHPHVVRGVVEHGRGEATAFGFPTANLALTPGTCLPKEGVYACIVTDGQHAWPAAANVGAPPSFSGPKEAFLEANLIGFEGNLYGKELCVIFVAWLRASRVFTSLEKLERTVLGNIEWVGQNLGSAPVEVKHDYR